MNRFKTRCSDDHERDVWPKNGAKECHDKLQRAQNKRLFVSESLVDLKSNLMWEHYTITFPMEATWSRHSTFRNGETLCSTTLGSKPKSGIAWEKRTENFLKKYSRIYCYQWFTFCIFNVLWTFKDTHTHTARTLPGILWVWNVSSGGCLLPVHHDPSATFSIRKQKIHHDVGVLHRWWLKEVDPNNNKWPVSSYYQSKRHNRLLIYVSG